MSDEEEYDTPVQLFRKGSNLSQQISHREIKESVDEEKPVKKKARPSLKEATFQSLGLDEWICNNLTKLSISKPTPVQEHCIPAILQNNKIVSAAAPTGSGKTAAFALPILDCLARDPYGIFALVVTPTRELALQIGEQFSTFGAPVGVRCEVIIGGLPLVAQQLALAKRPHIVVGTPGRLATHILGADPPSLKQLKFLVLDESDRLLTEGEGYESDLVRIGKALKLGSYQTLLFSATSRGKNDVSTCKRLGLTSSELPDFEFDANQESNNTQNPDSKSIVRLLPSKLEQSLSLIPFQAKHAYLAWFLKQFAPEKIIDGSKLKSISLKSEKIVKKKQVEVGVDQNNSRAKSLIIFTSTCEQCQLYAEMLIQLRIPCVSLHAEMRQKNRIENLTKFRSGRVAILVATDVASRGLDIPQVDIVLNLDVPRECENYIHRIGRCARAGRLGRSYLFVTQHDVELVNAVEDFIGKKLNTFEINDDNVTKILHKASVAKRKAVMKLHDNGFVARLQIRKERRRKIPANHSPQE